MIKISVCYHADFPRFSSDIFVPIQSGRVLTDRTLSDIAGDNTGDNISAKNSYYSELTVLYWLWKNYESIGNPNFIGLFHYRRFLNFRSDKKIVGNFYNFSPKTIKRFGWYSDIIADVCNDFDVILPVREKLIGLNGKPISIREHYGEGHILEDFDTVIKIVNTHHPRYAPYTESVANYDRAYMCNIFIMKKELFFKYAEFIFSVLAEFEKNIDMDKYENAYQRRVFGFLSERLFNVFIEAEREIAGLKVKEQQMLVGHFGMSLAGRIRKTAIYYAKHTCIWRNKKTD